MRLILPIHRNNQYCLDLNNRHILSFRMRDKLYYLIGFNIKFKYLIIYFCIGWMLSMRIVGTKIEELVTYGHIESQQQKLSQIDGCRLHEHYDMSVYVFWRVVDLIVFMIIGVENVWVPTISRISIIINNEDNDDGFIVFFEFV